MTTYVYKKAKNRIITIPMIYRQSFWGGVFGFAAPHGGGEYRVQPRNSDSRVLVLGDSLIDGHQKRIAKLITRQVVREGRKRPRILVSAVGGSALSHFVLPERGLTPHGHRDIRKPKGFGVELQKAQQYIADFKPDVTVLALGSNDARIIKGTTTKSTEGPAYTLDDYADSLKRAVDAALQGGNKAVVLVTIADHWYQVRRKTAEDLRDEVYEVEQQHRSRIYIVDWFQITENYQNKDALFEPDKFNKDGIRLGSDIHINSLGRGIYYQRIAEKVAKALINLKGPGH